MVQLLAVTDHIRSLAEAEQVYGISEQSSPEFFLEWTEDLPALTTDEQERLNLIKSRYLYHHQHGHLLENAVNFLVVSPLLEMAGLYDPPFLLKSEVSVRFEVEDTDEKIYQGRIDALVVQDYLWIVLVEAKRTSLNVTTALPQALAYMASSSDSQPKFGLVSNGEYFIFVKLDQSQYGLSDDFSLNRRRNDLTEVLRILKQLKTVWG
ncbi:MAG: type I restriction endonuclease subunit R [Symploca sp. SIO2B6]|nr:type I restriction endonuclease subunit R [Symploca sp. SIO2B6]